MIFFIGEQPPDKEINNRSDCHKENFIVTKNNNQFLLLLSFE